MKLIVILIASLFILQCYAIVLKKSKTEQTNLLAKMATGMNAQRAQNMNGYKYEILKEVNDYRKQKHYYPMIHWSNQLASTARSEAYSILRKHSFGEHKNFQTWRKKTRNHYFTELTLLVDTEGNVPPKEIFAKTIVESLKQEQEWYLIHEYTHGGVAILPTKKKNTYIIVIHLIKSKHKNVRLYRAPVIRRSKPRKAPVIRRRRVVRRRVVRRPKRPSRYTSCKQARRYGLRSSYMYIYPRGRRIRVRCDQYTAGGGWTRVLDMSRTRYGRVFQGINDLGLRYTQLYFKAKSAYFLDYYRPRRNIWDFNGYIFSLNALRFNSVWYLASQCPSRTQHNGLRRRLRHRYFSIHDRRTLQVLQSASKCYFDRINMRGHCARRFILKRLPGGRLNAISDLESIFNSASGDNRWSQYYEIYLR